MNRVTKMFLGFSAMALLSFSPRAFSQKVMVDQVIAVVGSDASLFPMLSKRYFKCEQKVCR